MAVILLTGSTGFVGTAVAQRLLGQAQHSLLMVCRHQKLHQFSKGKSLVVDNIDKNTDWTGALDGVGVVVHAAARAHVLNDRSSDPLSEFRKVNTDGTLNLARQAAKAGVKRFVFISSIGVNGNQSILPFTENDIPAPQEPYAVSKLEAEIGLQKIVAQSGMELTVIRPPLVYGPNAPGNFGSLMCWINKCVPLPLGAIHNRRSLVALDNLVDFILTCIDHPAAANQTFLVADGEDLSTSELLRGVGLVMNKPARLIPVPVVILKAIATLFGKRLMAQRLCESLQVDISKAREVLAWNPPVSVKEGLRKAVEPFIAR
jgi:nucleoside-diphosphate-sugar epimerase